MTDGNGVTKRTGWRSLNFSRLGFELLIVFFGVLGAFMVEGWRERSARQQLATQIYGGLHTEVLRTRNYLSFVVDVIDADLARFDSSYAAGLRPAPVYFRIEGSEQPPRGAFDAAMSAQSVGLLDPRLLADISSFYNEVVGVSDRFVRYATFTEARVLPYLDEPRVFYRPDADRLLPEHAAHMDRLRELRDYWQDQVEGAGVLLPQLARAAGMPADSGTTGR